MSSNAHLLTMSCGEGKCKESGTANAQKAQTPRLVFSKACLKAREGSLKVCDQLMCNSLVDGEAEEKGGKLLQVLPGSSQSLEGMC